MLGSINANVRLAPLIPPRKSPDRQFRDGDPRQPEPCIERIVTGFPEMAEILARQTRRQQGCDGGFRHMTPVIPGRFQMPPGLFGDLPGQGGQSVRSAQFQHVGGRHARLLRLLHRQHDPFCPRMVHQGPENPHQTLGKTGGLRGGVRRRVPPGQDGDPETA